MCVRMRTYLRTHVGIVRTHSSERTVRTLCTRSVRIVRIVRSHSTHSLRIVRTHVRTHRTFFKNEL